VNELPRGPGVVIYFEFDDLDKHVSEVLDEGIIFEELPTDKNLVVERGKTERS
jgi:hypothetical protein